MLLLQREEIVFRTLHNIITNFLKKKNVFLFLHEILHYPYQIAAIIHNSWEDSQYI